MVHDLIVIGGGPGGYGVGFRAAARGLDVAIVEEDEVGGTCLNRGCIPSKATLYVAEVLEQVHRADILGLDVTCNGIKGEQLDAFRNMVMDRMRNGLRSLVNERSTFYAGRGRIVEGRAELKQVEVTRERRHHDDPRGP